MTPKKRSKRSPTTSRRSSPATSGGQRHGKELLSELVNGIKNYTRAMEIIARVELVNYLGEDAGRVVANINDALTDTSVGITIGAINTAAIVTAIDPVGDPKGTLATLEGLGKMTEILNPMTASLALAKDPEGTIDVVKNLTHSTTSSPAIVPSSASASWVLISVPRSCLAELVGSPRQQGVCVVSRVTSTVLPPAEAGGAWVAAGST